MVPKIQKQPTARGGVCDICFKHPHERTYVSCSAGPGQEQGLIQQTETLYRLDTEADRWAGARAANTTARVGQTDFCGVACRAKHQHCYQSACSLDAGSLTSDQSGSGQPEASLHGPPPSASVASFPQSDQSGQADGGTISIRNLVLDPSACRPPANHVPCVPALCASLHLASRPMHPTGWPCIGRLRRAA